jgi:hypothetical protein
MKLGVTTDIEALNLMVDTDYENNLSPKAPSDISYSMRNKYMNKSWLSRLQTDHFVTRDNTLLSSLPKIESNVKPTSKSLRNVSDMSNGHYLSLFWFDSS